MRGEEFHDVPHHNLRRCLIDDRLLLVSVAEGFWQVDQYMFVRAGPLPILKFVKICSENQRKFFGSSNKLWVNLRQVVVSANGSSLRVSLLALTGINELARGEVVYFWAWV